LGNGTALTGPSFVAHLPRVVPSTRLQHEHLFPALAALGFVATLGAEKILFDVGVARCVLAQVLLAIVYIASLRGLRTTDGEGRGEAETAGTTATAMVRPLQEVRYVAVAEYGKEKGASVGGGHCFF
jgi:hypothetical protein